MNTNSISSPRSLPAGLTTIIRILLAAVLLGAAEGRVAHAADPGEGTILGQVFDGKTGTPVAGATVVVIWPAPPDGSEPRQEVRETGADGTFEFGFVPAGTYSLGFRKSGYLDSKLTDLSVQPGQAKRADFPLPPLPREKAADTSSDIEEFLVVGSEVAMESLQLRVDSDQLLNVLSAEELAKFAATDVAEGLKRVAGVNVVEGQFAVIRGLEDRYSSTTFNSAPVPSPDPDRQSMQLDLFPSEVVSNLVVAKTFAPGLPSNSSGGSIDVVTTEYPEDFELALKAKAGFNTNAIDRFLAFEDESPIGKETQGTSTIEQEYGGVVGGRTEFAGHELRYKALLNWEVDYDTAEGFQEAREPRPCNNSAQQCLPGQPVTIPGGLTSGQLGLSGGRFDLTTSERSVQSTGYLGLGFDLDQAGNHRIDTSTFYTRKEQETVQLKEHGFLPGFHYSVFANSGGEIQPGLWLPLGGGNATNSAVFRGSRESANDGPGRGPLWFTDFYESKSFDRERDLLVAQVNGEHWIDSLPGLHVGWAANYAHTTQEEKARGLRYFYEPDDVEQPATGPSTSAALGPGVFAASSRPFYNDVDVDENQGFGRMDADYTRAVSEAVTLALTSGGWYEHATRGVDSSFLESPTWTGGGSSNIALRGATQRELGRLSFTRLNLLPNGQPNGMRKQETDATREIWAWNLGSKATLFEKWDLLGGFRLEKIFIDSRNDAFTGTNSPYGGPETFPTRFLLFDHLDNPARGETVAGTTFNSDLLGINVPTTPCPTAANPGKTCVDLTNRAQIESLINGEIDELEFLPTAGFAVRLLEGLSLKGAWSKTVARPSFREMGYYVSVEPASDDLIVGNPQLKLSPVESFDLRTEYIFGDFADLIAVSGFYKTIQDPIESIVIRNPLNFEQASSALFRTFFNNPNEATVWGIEVEARKNLVFLDDLLGSHWAEYFTAGANYTYIHARVDRIDAELARAQPFFGVTPGGSAEFTSLDESRRLFGQPEWIVNADITFEQPDWGTRATLAWYAISDVLDAAGSVFIGPNGVTQSYVPDRYVDSYGQLDLIVSQEIWHGLTLSVQLKNLTDSTRRIVYDPYQTSERIAERSVKEGRDFKLQLKYAF